ncbi:MAG: NUDIX domain-containing protein [Prevotellaceae bacterium]|jgi:mutator protein MutT|nr:NUDIX domain-containing protein [Prevotellaceae bacterium]
MEKSRDYQKYHPSEVFKFCPYCGAAGFSWDGVKAFSCATCEYRYYINEAAAVVALIENEKRELLFTVRKRDPFKGMLDLPGGFVDIGETAEDAVRREIKEELDLTIDGLTFFGTFPNRYVFGGIVYFTLDVAFRAKIKDFSSIKASDDVESYQFISQEEIRLGAIGLDSIKEIVKQYKQKYGSI